MAVDRDRVVAVRAAIAEQARLDGMPVSVVHVCRAAVQLTGAEGAGVSTISSRSGMFEPVQVTGPLGEALSELQVTLGEGPGVTALAQDRPVLVPDLDTAGTQHRWPLFASGAMLAGAGAMFALPLMAGKIAVGVLEIYRSVAGWLSERELTDGLLLADAALLQLVTDATAEQTGPLPPAAGPDADAFMDRWPQVHQATGMVSVQLDTDLASAFLRLRARAFADGRGLREVADDVVARRLRFTPDPDPPDSPPAAGPAVPEPDL
ncbi:GAF and ANTAR domain-containing protein [Spirillospora sp. NPDC047279]|uniref:GAF and ANTAR domain-containing protein n=1 Tax=Spirillospora sp. NPDC047279 TaxID=3155478 RepID=UPI0033F4D49D